LKNPLRSTQSVQRNQIEYFNGHNAASEQTGLKLSTDEKRQRIKPIDRKMIKAKLLVHGAEQIISHYFNKNFLAQWTQNFPCELVPLWWFGCNCQVSVCSGWLSAFSESP
jgi:hypothetical protein